jgi:catechol 2,3-dioxygenase-like lactoylglutathione lyase family enzyme
MSSFVGGLDSVVFETPDLARVRAFYADVIGLRVGKFHKDGRQLPDESDTYVNFDTGAMLCFEKGTAAQLGTIVLRVTELPSALEALAAHGVNPVRATAAFAIIRDPDGREVILQTNTQ